jgi:hypothetical protein
MLDDDGEGVVAAHLIKCIRSNGVSGVCVCACYYARNIDGNVFE